MFKYAKILRLQEMVLSLYVTEQSSHACEGFTLVCDTLIYTCDGILKIFGDNNITCDCIVIVGAGLPRYVTLAITSISHIKGTRSWIVKCAF